MKSKAHSLKKINKIHESLVDLKRKNEKIKTINIKNQRRHITTDPTDIKEILRKLYKEFYVNAFSHSEEM